MFEDVRRDIWRRTEVIKTIPKKATAVAETSTIINKGCYYMIKFFTSLYFLLLTIVFAQLLSSKKRSLTILT